MMQSNGLPRCVRQPNYVRYSFGVDMKSCWSYMGFKRSLSGTPALTSRFAQACNDVDNTIVFYSEIPCILRMSIHVLINQMMYVAWKIIGQNIRTSLLRSTELSSVLRQQVACHLRLEERRGVSSVQRAGVWPPYSPKPEMMFSKLLYIILHFSFFIAK